MQLLLDTCASSLLNFSSIARAVPGTSLLCYSSSTEMFPRLHHSAATAAAGLRFRARCRHTTNRLAARQHHHGGHMAKNVARLPQMLMLAARLCSDQWDCVKQGSNGAKRPDIFSIKRALPVKIRDDDPPQFARFATPVDGDRAISNVIDKSDHAPRPVMDDGQQKAVSPPTRACSGGSGGGDAGVGSGTSSESSPVSACEESPSPPLVVLYRDQHISAVCKPPLMHVHYPEFGSKDKEFVLQKARDQLGERVYFPHRLDRGTSGCLLLGFSPEASKALHRALADGRSRKTYVAIVRGSGQAYIDKGWFTVDRPLKDKNNFKEATTRFRFVAGGEAPGPRCCLVLAQPATGRLHQIRRHLKGLGHPVVGDSVHGESRFNRDIVKDHGAPAGRLLLHCLRIHLPTLRRPGSDIWHGEEAYGRAERSREIGARSQECEERGDMRERRSLEHGKQFQGEKSSHDIDEEGGLFQGFPPGMLKNHDAGGVAPDFSISSVGLRDDADCVGTLVRSGVTGESGEIRKDGQHGGLEKSVSLSLPGDSDDWQGLSVSCPPPDDFMGMLRLMPWWEEGIIEAAENAR